jgi:CHASE3 domain sensor protein
MKNRFLYIALVLSIGILLWLGRIYIQQNKLQLRYTGEVERTYRVIITLHNCEQLLTDAESAQRGYLFTGKEAFKTFYALSVSRIDSTLDQLQSSTADNITQRVNFKLLEPAIRERLALMNLNLERKDNHRDKGLCR